MTRALRHFEPWLVLSNAMSMHTIRRAECMRRITCEVYLSTKLSVSTVVKQAMEPMTLCAARAKARPMGNQVVF